MSDASFFNDGQRGTPTTTQTNPGTPTTTASTAGTSTRTAVAPGTSTTATTAPGSPSVTDDIYVISGLVQTGNVPILRLRRNDGQNVDINVSALIGSPGPPGPQGPRGDRGPAGMNGLSVDGLTIVSAGSSTTPTIIQFTESGNDIGPQVSINPGPAGANGTPGTNGRDGTSVDGVTVVQQGNTTRPTIIQFTSNGSNVGPQVTIPVGPQGAQGDAGDPVDGVRVVTAGNPTTPTTIQFQVDGDDIGSTVDISPGPQGPAGPRGTQGPQGDQGDAATVNVGTVTTGNPGTDAQVTNSGDQNNAVLDFVIPRGADGSGGGGTVVTANPAVTSGDPLLHSIGIGDTDYRIGDGGGSQGSDVEGNPTDTSDLTNRGLLNTLRINNDIFLIAEGDTPVASFSTPSLNRDLFSGEGTESFVINVVNGSIGANDPVITVDSQSITPTLSYNADRTRVSFDHTFPNQTTANTQAVTVTIQLVDNAAIPQTRDSVISTQVRFLDRRELPTIAPMSINRSILDNTANETFDITFVPAGTAVVNGTAYDINTGNWMVNGSRDGIIGTNRFTAPLTDSNETFTFTFSYNSNPSNGQTGAIPDIIRNVTVFTPYFWTVSSNAPTGISGLTQVSRNIADGQTVDVTGTVGQRIWFVVPSTFTPLVLSTVASVVNPVLDSNFTVTTGANSTLTYNVWRVGEFTGNVTYTIGD